MTEEDSAVIADMSNRIDGAINILFQWGQTDGAHHKAWVIDQVARMLLGEGYAEWCADYEAGDCEWDRGIEP